MNKNTQCELCGDKEQGRICLLCHNKKIKEAKREAYDILIKKFRSTQGFQSCTLQSNLDLAIRITKALRDKKESRREK